MSKQLWKSTKELPSGNLFYGGKRGKCIQLTKKEEKGYQYITIPVRFIPNLIKKLQLIKSDIHIKEALDEIEKFIKEEYGKKCKKYADGCCTCRVWFLFENLKDYLLYQLEEEDVNPEYKKKLKKIIKKSKKKSVIATPPISNIYTKTKKK